MAPEKLTRLFDLGYEVDTLVRKWREDTYVVHVRSPFDVLVVRCHMVDGQAHTEIVRGPRNTPLRSAEEAHAAIIEHIARIEHGILASLAEVAVPPHAAENA